MNGAEGQQEGSVPPGAHSPKPWFRMSEVFHPFDPQDDNAVAFVHALRLAWFARARLSLMCWRSPQSLADGDPRPQAREMLARWASKNALRGSESDVEQELNIRMFQTAAPDPVPECVRFLGDNLTDLIVLTAALHQGKTSWLRGSAAEALARKTGEMALFIPEGVRGFVAPEDGAVSLKSILIPVAAEPSPGPAIEAARRVMLSVPQAQGTVVLLHVGDSSGMPETRLPEVPGWTWRRICREGAVADTILETAAAIKADLIAMTTFGTHGFLDVLRGTVSQQILRRANCPLLSMPEGSFLG
jgi:nucleotide-binding universal stress UspA family protein